MTKAILEIDGQKYFATEINTEQVIDEYFSLRHEPNPSGTVSLGVVMRTPDPEKPGVPQETFHPLPELSNIKPGHLADVCIQIRHEGIDDYWHSISLVHHKEVKPFIYDMRQEVSDKR